MASPAISSPHASGASGLFAGPAGDGTLQFKHRPGHLVLQAWTTLVVVHGRSRGGVACPTGRIAVRPGFSGGSGRGCRRGGVLATTEAGHETGLRGSLAGNRHDDVLF